MSPEQYRERIEAQEAGLLAREYDRGYSDGRDPSAGYCPR
jgi:hypothetical protein